MPKLDGRSVANFWRDARGLGAVTFALILAPICVAGTAAMEIFEVLETKVQLQAIVDSAALKGASEFTLDRSSATEERARAYADGLANPYRRLWSVTTLVRADPATGKLSAVLDASRASLFGNILPPGSWRLHVAATAIQKAKQPVCVLATGTGGVQGIHLRQNSAVAASGCAVQSNSGMLIEHGAWLSAAAVRTAKGAVGSISPPALTDAPRGPDPFAYLDIDVPPVCTENFSRYKSGTVTLDPGVHCGNIELKGNARLTLKPGEHYFAEGRVKAEGNAAIVGRDVVLIFKGEPAMQLKGNALLAVEGRQSGAYAGFVLITDRSFTGTLELSTANVHKMRGIVYLPSATLAVAGSPDKLASTVVWPIVVSKAIEVTGSAKLVADSSGAAHSPPDARVRNRTVPVAP